MSGGGLRGRLLVASPQLLDPSFRRTVVLLLEHGEEGAVGVVLNRPTEMEVAEPLPSWAPLATHPDVVFIGGPVERSSAICLGLGRAPRDVDGWSPLFDGLGTVDLNLGPSAVPGLLAVRFFAGYAGWSADQLEGELAQGGWVVCELEGGDVLTGEPDELWRRVLARQRGLTGLREAPVDLGLN